MDSTKGKSPVNYHHHLFFFPTLGKSKNGQVFEQWNFAETFILEALPSSETLSERHFFDLEDIQLWICSK